MFFQLIVILGSINVIFVFASGDSINLVGKPAYQSSTAYGGVASRAVDGNKDGFYNNGHCSYTQTGGRQWIVIDLVGVYDIKNVLIWSRTNYYGKYGMMRNFSVFVGDSFKPCREDLFNKYRFCASYTNVQPRLTTVPCNQRGQFILVVKGHQNIRGKGVDTTLVACEIEATGSLVVGAKPFLKPRIPKFDPSPMKPMNSLNAHKTITQTLTQLKVHWDVQHMNVIKSSVEPILWLPDEQMVYMAGAKLGNGKIIAISSQGMWNRIQNGAEHSLERGMKLWLTGNASAPHQDYWRVPITTIKAGTVVYIRYQAYENQSRIESLLEYVRNGTLALVLSCPSENDKDSEWMFPIWKSVGIYVDPKSGPLSREKVISMASMNSKPVFPLETSIQMLHKSFTAFIVYVKITADILEYLPIDFKALIQFPQNVVANVVKQYNEIMEWECPRPSHPASSNDQKQFATVFGNLLLNSAHLIDSGFKAPGVTAFPGDFNEEPQLINRTIEIYAEFKREYHATGLYLPAGKTMTVTMIDSTNNDYWYIQLGCWRDDISPKNNWKRFPRIAIATLLQNNKIHSAFGGTIKIWNGYKNARIKIRFEGVVEAPYFNLRDPVNIRNWNSRRNAIGLWAELEGDAMGFCVPSYAIRKWNVEYVKEVMETWDKALKADYNLVGEDWKYQRRELAVTDLQIRMGAYHSGYPIMSMLNYYVNFLNIEKMKSVGSWGMSHELGHNRERVQFTIEGSHHLTANIFAVWNMHAVWNLPTFVKYKYPFSKVDKIKNYLAGSVTYENWAKDSLIALTIFPQMSNSFGWGVLKETFRIFLRNDIPQPTKIPDIIDQWMIRVSQVANVNVGPLFEFWGLPLSSAAKSNVSNLPCYLPDDFVTRLAPTNRVFQIMNEFGGNCRRTTAPVKDRYPIVLTPLRKNDVIIHHELK